MEGIYLLAATSRPDLIDSAIIRNVKFFIKQNHFYIKKGRIDTHIFLNFPNY